MAKNHLGIIIRHEYLSDIRAKSFWIATFVTPLIMIGFGGFVGYLSAQSESFSSFTPDPSDQPEMSGYQLLGMMLGMVLTLFLMVYGAQIFNKVKQEKCNRIVEVLATCVTGRTMMLAKIITVALTGLTQLLLWGAILAFGGYIIWIMFAPEIPLEVFGHARFYLTLGGGLLYFAGGYVLYASLFAAVGAMADKNNENQEYMTIITFLLLASFYIGMYAVDNTGSAMTTACLYIPFISPTLGPICLGADHCNYWQILLSLLILYATSSVALVISGKIYTSSLLLTGRKLSVRDIALFLKSK